jgi:hypothetical protein
LSQGNAGALSMGSITDAAAKFRKKWTLDGPGNWTDFQQDGLMPYQPVEKWDWLADK